MMWRLVAALVGGFATHQLEKPILNRFGNSRWELIVRYAIGSLALIPFRLLVIGGLQDDEKCCSEEHVLAGDLLTLGGFGTGVFLGYLTDGE